MNLERLRDSLDVISPQNIADMKLELKYATYTDQVKLYNRFIVFNFIGLRVGIKIHHNSTHKNFIHSFKRFITSTNLTTP